MDNKQKEPLYKSDLIKLKIIEETQPIHKKLSSSRTSDKKIISHQRNSAATLTDMGPGNSEKKKPDASKEFTPKVLKNYSETLNLHTESKIRREKSTNPFQNNDNYDTPKISIKELLNNKTNLFSYNSNIPRNQGSHEEYHNEFRSNEEKKRKIDQGLSEILNKWVDILIEIEKRINEEISKKRKIVSSPDYLKKNSDKYGSYVYFQYLL